MTKKQKKTRNRILIVLAIFVILLILDKTGVMDPLPWYVRQGYKPSAPRR